MTNRCATLTAKMPAEETGLAAAVYVHVETDSAGNIVGFQISSPGKFANTGIERLMDVISQEATALMLGGRMSGPISRRWRACRAWLWRVLTDREALRGTGQGRAEPASDHQTHAAP